MVPALDHSGAAAEAVQQFRPFGLHLDFTAASLRAVDFFFDQMWGPGGANAVARAEGEAQAALDPKKFEIIVLFGSYLGEVLRRQFGGDWRRHPEHPDNVLHDVLALPGGAEAFPLSRVAKRLMQGAADALYPYYVAIRDALGHESASAQEATEWLTQGARFLELSRFDFALPFFETAQRLDPELAEINFARGDCLDQLGRHDEAIAAFEQYLQMAPDAPAERRESAQARIAGAKQALENAADEATSD